MLKGLRKDRKLQNQCAATYVLLYSTYDRHCRFRKDSNQSSQILTVRTPAFAVTAYLKNTYNVQDVKKISHPGAGEFLFNRRTDGRWSSCIDRLSVSSSHRRHTHQKTYHHNIRRLVLLIKRTTRQDGKFISSRGKVSFETHGSGRGLRLIGVFEEGV